MRQCQGTGSGNGNPRDLEAANVVRGLVVGRPPQDGGEAPNVADVVALSFAREPAHGTRIKSRWIRGYPSGPLR